MTRRPDITAVLQQGRRHRTPRLDISWRRNELGHPRLGVIVPRHHRTAVDRNRVRRRIREIMRRRALPKVNHIDIIVRARPPAYDAPFQQLASDLDQWLRSLSD